MENRKNVADGDAARKPERKRSTTRRRRSSARASHREPVVASTRTRALFSGFRAGDSAARSELLRHLNVRLRTVAEKVGRRDRNDPLVQVTALIDHALLDIHRVDSKKVRSFEHLVGRAIRVMSNALKDAAKARKRQRRAGARPLEGLPEPAARDAPDVIEQWELLELIRRKHPSQVQILELRFYVGSAKVISEQLEMPLGAVRNRLRKASEIVNKEWLRLVSSDARRR